MKNTSLLGQIKCIIKNDCDGIEDHKPEMQIEEIKDENTGTELDFQLFDIDEVFAN